MRCLYLHQRLDLLKSLILYSEEIEEVKEGDKGEEKVLENQQTKQTRFSAPTSLETKPKAKKKARVKKVAEDKNSGEKNVTEEDKNKK